MKKQVSDYVKFLGGTAEYSGNSKTMFINSPTGRNDIEAGVRNHFGVGLPFMLKTNH